MRLELVAKRLEKRFTGCLAHLEGPSRRQAQYNIHEGIVRVTVGDAVVLSGHRARAQAADRQGLDSRRRLVKPADESLDIHRFLEIC